MKKLLLYSFALLAFSCTKLVDMPITNGPQFEMHAEIDGDSLNLVAGDEDVVYSVSCEEVNGVMVYTGEFEFDNGNKILRFELFDHARPFEDDNSVQLMNDQTSYSNLSSQPAGYLFFDSSAVHGQSVSGAEWLVDGVPQTGNFFLVNEPGIYDVQLNFQFAGGQSQLNNKVYLGFDNPTWGYFDVNSLGYGEFEFESHVQNSGATVEWIIDGTNVYQQSTLMTVLDTGVHKVVMHVTDTDGHEYFREKNVGYVADNYVSEFGFLKQNSDDLHNTVIVSYIEYGADTTVYTSKLLNQNNSSLSAGLQERIMETNQDVVLKFPVDMNFQLLNQDDFGDLKNVSLSGKLGFLVEK